MILVAQRRLAHGRKWTLPVAEGESHQWGTTFPAKGRLNTHPDRRVDLGGILDMVTKLKG